MWCMQQHQWVALGNRHKSLGGFERDYLGGGQRKVELSFAAGDRQRALNAVAEDHAVVSDRAFLFALRVIGCTPRDDKNTIIDKWKSIVVENHPDKLMGLPEEERLERQSTVQSANAAKEVLAKYFGSWQKD